MIKVIYTLCPSPFLVLKYPLACAIYIYFMSLSFFGKVSIAPLFCPLALALRPERPFTRKDLDV